MLKKEKWRRGVKRCKRRGGKEIDIEQCKRSVCVLLVLLRFTGRSNSFSAAMHTFCNFTLPRSTLPDGAQQYVQLHTSNLQDLLMKPPRCSWNSVLKSSSTGFDTDQVPLGYLLLDSYTVRISVDRTEALNRPSGNKFLLLSIRLSKWRHVSAFYSNEAIIRSNTCSLERSLPSYV